MPIDPNNLSQAQNTLQNVDFGSGGGFSVDPRYVQNLVAPDQSGANLLDRANQSNQQMEADILAGREQLYAQGQQSGQQAFDNTYQTSRQSRGVATDIANDTARMRETYETARRNQFKSSASQVRSAFVFASEQTRAMADEMASLLDAETARAQQEQRAQQLQGLLPAMMGEGFARDLSVLGQYQGGRQFRDTGGRDLADMMALLQLAESGRAAGVDDASRRVFG